MASQRYNDASLMPWIRYAPPRSTACHSGSGALSSTGATPDSPRPDQPAGQRSNLDQARREVAGRYVPAGSGRSRGALCLARRTQARGTVGAPWHAPGWPADSRCGPIDRRLYRLRVTFWSTACHRHRGRPWSARCRAARRSSRHLPGGAQRPCHGQGATPERRHCPTCAIRVEHGGDGCLLHLPDTDPARADETAAARGRATVTSEATVRGRTGQGQCPGRRHRPELTWRGGSAHSALRRAEWLSDTAVERQPDTRRRRQSRISSPCPPSGGRMRQA